ncbi:MAG TPA: CatA-like O-acetyltransferase [Vicinamibacterales bacterium]|nr:CatA-like O-acetyltransferase [Vicinamibacterales bacterium]
MRRTGHLVDLKSWKRRAHYELFKTYSQPFFSVTVDVDVTSLWNRCRRRPAGPSFFLTSLFLMLNAVNETEAFRLRLRRRGVWRWNRVAVGPTILKADETFGFVRVEASGSLDRFTAAGGAAIAGAAGRKALEPMTGTDDIVFHSVLPWLRFTSFANALPGGDSIPRIVFGRCSKDGRAVRMPVAVEVHHALVDGLDVARFLERFEAGLSRSG